VTYSANQALDAPPNRLAGESMPNILGGVGMPGAARPFSGRSRLFAAVTVMVVAGFALVLLWWRA
jgi:hypothetical protein